MLGAADSKSRFWPHPSRSTNKISHNTCEELVLLSRHKITKHCTLGIDSNITTIPKLLLQLRSCNGHNTPAATNQDDVHMKVIHSSTL